MLNNDMIIDENDEQSALNNKVMCFVILHDVWNGACCTHSKLSHCSSVMILFVIVVTKYSVDL